MLGKISAKGIKVTPESLQAMKTLGEGTLPKEQAAPQEVGPSTAAPAAAVPAEEVVAPA